MEHMPASTSRTSRVTRRTLLVGTAAALSGCTLRLEHGKAPLGPEQKPSADIGILKEVRVDLVQVIKATSGTDAVARDLAKIEPQQLRQLDATIKGLGGNLEGLEQPTASVSSPTSTPAPAASSKGAPSATPTASSTSASSGSASPTSASKQLTTEVQGWASPTNTTRFAQLTNDTRGMAMSLAAAQLGVLFHSGATTTWSATASVPAQSTGALLASIEPAIQIAEWKIARTPVKERQRLQSLLRWLYAARSFTAAQPQATNSAGTQDNTRGWVPTSQKQADTWLKQLMPRLLSDCAQAAKEVKSADEASGVLFIWAHAAGASADLGVTVKAFPGLQ